MSDTKNVDLHWGQRALAYAQKFSEFITVVEFPTDNGRDKSENYIHPGRGSATEAEKRASETVHQQLNYLGIDQVFTQTFKGLRSIWLFIAQAFGFALAGHGAFWLLSRPAGIWPAWIVSSIFFSFSFYVLWQKFSFREPPLHEALPQGTSQNVIASIQPTGEVSQKIILIAHLDSHRAVLWFANKTLLKFYHAAVPLVMYGIIAAPLLYLLSNLPNLTIIGYGAVFFGVFHFAAWMSGMIADLGPYSPGANDNASSVGSLLAVAERLKEQPLQNTEVWLAFTGCAETGCSGLLELIKEKGEEFQKALWLDLELVGIGDELVYLTREGILKKNQINPDVEQKLLLAAQNAEISLQGIDAGFKGVFTEAGALWEYGYNAACLVSMRQGKSELQEWHRISDTIDHLEPFALDRTHNLVWSLLQVVDNQP